MGGTSTVASRIRLPVNPLIPMAGLPASSSSTSSDIVQVVKLIQRVGCCLDLSVQNYELSDKKLSWYFSRVLNIFQNEIQQPKNIRPFPALLGDGEAVDLSKLYFVVHEKGGYESVTIDKGWSLVSEALGFDSGVGSCVKLVYAKYLYGVEKWFTKLLVNNKEAAKEVCGLKVEVNGLDLVEDEAKGTPAYDAKKSHFLTPNRDGRRLKLDLDEKGCNDVVIIETKSGDKSSSRKRKRDDFDEMLGWLKNFARSPLNLIDENMSSYGEEDIGGNVVGQFCSQVLLAREHMFVKRLRLMKGDMDNPTLQKHQRVHPSMYEDGTDPDKSEKLRQSERIQSGNKQPYSSSRSQSPSIHSNGINNQKSRKSNPLLEIMANLQQTEHKYQPVPISSNFQAKLPPLMDKSSYNNDTSSSKWLGTQIWPQENKKHNHFEHRPIGKGKTISCKCENPTSVQCIRLHIAEQRLKLKNELGFAFHQWGFDRMGEEVALSWTKQEAKKFKDVVRSYVANMDNSVWKHLKLAFPSKKKKELVSYYFNVFTLSRRCYQNRVTPKEVDSDDDGEFCFLSVPFGQDAMEVKKKKKKKKKKKCVCVENTQCVDFDDD